MAYGEGVAAQFDGMPHDMVWEIVRRLDPPALLGLRGVSNGMRAEVDDYVQQLINSGELRDWYGNDLRQAGLDPSEALTGWAGDQFGTPSFPIQTPPMDAQSIQAKYDGVFGNFPGPPDVLLQVYDHTVQQGGQDGLERRYEIETYIRVLLNAGRLVSLDGEALDRQTPVDTAWNKWRNGDVRWSR